MACDEWKCGSRLYASLSDAIYARLNCSNYAGRIDFLFFLHKLVGYLFKNKYTFNIFILHLIFFFEIMVILLKIITTFLKTNTLSKEEPNTDLLSGISEDSSVSMKKSVYLKHVVETEDL